MCSVLPDASLCLISARSFLPASLAFSRACRNPIQTYTGTLISKNGAACLKLAEGKGNKTSQQLESICQQGEVTSEKAK